MQIKFKRNMNKYDRGLRAIVGSALLILGPVTEYITIDDLSGIIMGVLGSTALISAFFSYCILYEVTGFDTTRSSDESSK
ncbi:MAG: DUF2892 domain-containing protein [Thioalkalispiraceae bacterium]|jgi:hypothetical protein